MAVETMQPGGAKKCTAAEEEETGADGAEVGIVVVVIDHINDQSIPSWPLCVFVELSQDCLPNRIPYSSHDQIRVEVWYIICSGSLQVSIAGLPLAE
jgi:hypothetical protein